MDDDPDFIPGGDDPESEPETKETVCIRFVLHFYFFFWNEGQMS